MKILAICGSLRSASYNRMLLNAAKQAASSELTFAEADIAPIPMFNQDVEAKGDPEPVKAFKAAIAAADALLIATPEYNYGVPGALKNAIDWASRPATGSVLEGKPVGIMGASMGMMGTVRCQLQLRQVFHFTESPVMLHPEMLVGRAQDKFDANGNLTDEPTKAFMGKYMAAFEAFARKSLR